MPKDNVVLLSGGLDSTVNFYLAMADGGVETALTVDYGQTAAPSELYRTKELCQRCGVEHLIVSLPWMRGVSPLSPEEEIQEFYPSWLKDERRVEEASMAVWVPNRNGVISNIGAAIADARAVPKVVFGANLDEGKYFPDNTREYMQAQTWAWKLSTKHQVSFYSYTAAWGKKRMFQKAVELGVDFALLWPCYRSGTKLCGRCLSCVLFWDSGKDLARERLEPLFEQIPEG